MPNNMMPRQDEHILSYGFRMLGFGIAETATQLWSQVSKRRENMSFLSNPDGQFHMGREERLWNFIHQVRELLHNRCELDEWWEESSYDALIWHKRMCPKGEFTELLGCVKGRHLFLDGDILFREVKILSASEGIDINSSKAIYYAEMVEHGAIIPNNAILNQIEYKQVIYGEEHRCVCLLADLINVPIRERYFNEG